jgi:transcriptional regulator with XRE-family HTH domain
MKGGGDMYKTFAEMNELLRTAIKIKYERGQNVEGIAAATGISSAMLYKWRSGSSNLSGDKFDSLLKYFEEQEPQRLEMAERIMGW